MLTLHEAIEHAREVSRRGCTECHKEHGQLADWLEELERRREEENCPRVHARWEIVVGSNGREYMVCTNCRVQQDLTGMFSYCPNCGASMDEPPE